MRLKKLKLHQLKNRLQQIYPNVCIYEKYLISLNKILTQFVYLVMLLYISQGILVYLLVNSILKIIVYLQMLYSKLEDLQVAPPT